MKIWRPHRCNCLIWALAMRIRYGGKTAWRWSYVGWYPHYFWSPDRKRLLEYVPRDYNDDRGLKTFWFKGQVQEMLSEVIEKRVIVDGVSMITRLDMTDEIKLGLG